MEAATFNPLFEDSVETAVVSQSTTSEAVAAAKQQQLQQRATSDRYGQQMREQRTHQQQEGKNSERRQEKLLKTQQNDFPKGGRPVTFWQQQQQQCSYPKHTLQQQHCQKRENARHHQHQMQLLLSEGKVAENSPPDDAESTLQSGGKKRKKAYFRKRPASEKARHLKQRRKERMLRHAQVQQHVQQLLQHQNTSASCNIRIGTHTKETPIGCGTAASHGSATVAKSASAEVTAAARPLGEKALSVHKQETQAEGGSATSIHDNSGATTGLAARETADVFEETSSSVFVGPRLPKKKYALFFAYDGEKFHGLQKQLEDSIEEQAARLLKLKTAAQRVDHAATVHISNSAAAPVEKSPAATPSLPAAAENQTDQLVVHTAATSGAVAAAAGVSEAAAISTTTNECYSSNNVVENSDPTNLETLQQQQVQPQQAQQEKKHEFPQRWRQQELEQVRTVEGVLEEALVKAGGIAAAHAGCLQKLQWSRAARTDRGVHAACNVISLKLSLGWLPSFSGKTAAKAKSAAITKRTREAESATLRIATPAAIALSGGAATAATATLQPVVVSLVPPSVDSLSKEQAEKQLGAAASAKAALVHIEEADATGSAANAQEIDGSSFSETWSQCSTAASQSTAKIHSANDDVAQAKQLGGQQRQLLQQEGQSRNTTGTATLAGLGLDALDCRSSNDSEVNCASTAAAASSSKSTLGTAASAPTADVNESDDEAEGIGGEERIAEPAVLASAATAGEEGRDMDTKAKWQREREDAFLKRLNAALPSDVRCFALRRVTKTFDARKSCSGRRYAFYLPAWVLQPVVLRKDIFQQFLEYQKFAVVTSTHAPSKFNSSSSRTKCNSGTVNVGERSSSHSGNSAIGISNSGSSSSSIVAVAVASGASVSAATLAPTHRLAYTDKAQSVNMEKVAAEKPRLLQRLTGSPPPVTSNLQVIQTHFSSYCAQYKEQQEQQGQVLLEQLQQQGASSTEALAARLRAVLKVYEGTHCFCNFTKRTKNRDVSPASFKRHIRQTSVHITRLEGVPFDILEVRLEGQAFLYNQIRKMIGLAVEVCRGTACVASLCDALHARGNSVFIHTAPAEGLLLLAPLYTAYNARQTTSVEFPPLDPESMEGDIKQFVSELLLPKIASACNVELWTAWLEDVDWHPFFLENMHAYKSSLSLDEATHTAGN